MQRYLIDQEHSNAFTAWLRLGSPAQPTPEQYAQLEKAGHLAAASAPEILKIENATATVRLKLPRQAVALLVLEWTPAAQ